MNNDSPDHDHLQSHGNVNTNITGGGNANHTNGTYYTDGWRTSGAQARHTHSAWTGGISANHVHGITVDASGNAEARPINYTMQVWKRTA